MEFVLNVAQKERIQVIRAIAIFMVIMTHTVLWNPYEFYIRPFINPAVAMFVFLSGLLTKEEIKGKEIFSFYKRRFLRVFIPYTLWSIIYVVYQGNYDTALKDYLIGNCCSTFYYIIVYIQLVIITPLAGALIQSKIRWVGFVITPVAIIVEYVLVFLGKNVTYPYNINNFFVWFIFFYLGMFVRIRYKNNKNVSSKGIKLLCMALLILCIMLEYIEGNFWIIHERMDLATSQVKLSTMCTGIAACILASAFILKKTEKRPLKLFVLIGDASFGLYLMHQLIMSLWGKLFPGLVLTTNYWFIVEAVVVLAIGFVIIYVLQLILGKRIGKYIGVY